MAPRPFWKGYLKLSLVTCPVAMAPATSDGEKVKFHTLNRKTGNRIVTRNIDAVTDEVVEDDDEVKGYERDKNEYVMLEEEEIRAVALESTRTIDIETFVPAKSIDWIWYDKPHYLTPNDTVGEEAFSVIRDAMAATGTVGISRLVMYNREHAVMLEPHDKGIVLWTLRYGDEVRDEDAYFEKVEGDKPGAKQMALVKKLIEERSRPWNAEMVGDPVQANLLDLIASKKKGRKRPAKAKTAETEAPTNVVNIMDALRKSISSDKKTAKSG